MNNLLFKVEKVWKSFPTAGQDTTVLKDISLEINHGEFIVIFGASGSGKSTLLHTLLGLEQPSKGSVWLDKTNLYAVSEDSRTKLRKKMIGMIYQQSLWVHSLNVIENVALPLLLQGQSAEQASSIALNALKVLSMDPWAKYLPTELSSGQQQRISLARALVIKPSIIVADEPTGNLDFENGQHLLQTLAEINKAGTTIIMVTHDLSYLSYADRAIEIHNGAVKHEWTAAEIKQHLKKHYWPTISPSTHE